MPETIASFEEICRKLDCFNAVLSMNSVTLLRNSLKQTYEPHPQYTSKIFTCSINQDVHQEQVPVLKLYSTLYTANIFASL